MSVKWKAKAHFIQNVPGGSTLEARISPNQAPITAAARVLVLGGDKVKWSHSDLAPGPATLPIQGGFAYRPHFFLLFFDEATVKIEIRVLDPGGAVFEEGFWEISGGREDEEERKLFLTT
jgi:hypothetical protein